MNLFVSKIIFLQRNWRRFLNKSLWNLKGFYVCFPSVDKFLIKVSKKDSKTRSMDFHIAFLLMTQNILCIGHLLFSMRIDNLWSWLSQSNHCLGWLRQLGVICRTKQIFLPLLGVYVVAIYNLPRTKDFVYKM